LWMVEGERPSYLYGTIHLPDPRVLALPPVVTAALASSDVFFAELPLESAQTRELDARSKLPKGQTLKDVLPPEVYDRTAKYFRAKGVNLSGLANRKVWFVAVTASVLDRLWDFILRQPLDQKLYNQAKGEHKQVGGLETVEEQLAVLDSLSTPEQIEQLVTTLDACEQAAREGTSYSQKLVGTYLRGDEDELLEELRQGADVESESGQKLYTKLITERNQRMADRIIAQLRSRPHTAFFFAVGAGHMVGADGIVARLAAAGFTVRRLTPEDAGKLAPARNAGH
jgi:uncharacterized protein